MLNAAVFAARRHALRALVSGPILLLGNGARPRNLPGVRLPFRQDSNFLYLTGCTIPGAAMTLVGEKMTLFLPPRAHDDDLWHGPQPSPQELGAALGADEVRSTTDLDAAIGGLGVHTLAIPDFARTQWLSKHTGTQLAYGSQHGSTALINALITMRRVKSPEELQELRAAAAISARAHIAVMKATRPGTTEKALAALFEGVLSAHHATPGYGVILSQRGEVLHMETHNGTLTEGGLLLLDGGGEVPSGYTVDITRTYPVSGTFTGRQRATYEAVLESQRVAIELCRPGVRYREVHDAACRVLAQFLKDEGLLNVSPDVALESGAHGVFYPHGTGHLLGLDVHDLENFGDWPSYPAGQSRPSQFGTQNLRLDLPLEPNWVVTIEPGIYIVPAILNNTALREQLGDQVNWSAAEEWQGFGGIRIEDDIAVTTDAPENLTVAVPKDIETLEKIVGSGRPAHEIFA